MGYIHTPRQIVDGIKEQTEPRIWGKDLRNWYVAEIMDLVGYNLIEQMKDLDRWHKKNGYADGSWVEAKKFLESRVEGGKVGWDEKPQRGINLTKKLWTKRRKTAKGKN